MIEFWKLEFDSFASEASYSRERSEVLSDLQVLIFPEIFSYDMKWCRNLTNCKKLKFFLMFASRFTKGKKKSHLIASTHFSLTTFLRLFRYRSFSFFYHYERIHFSIIDTVDVEMTSIAADSKVYNFLLCSRDSQTISPKFFLNRLEENVVF